MTEKHRTHIPKSFHELMEDLRGIPDYSPIIEKPLVLAPMENSEKHKVILSVQEIIQYYLKCDFQFYCKKYQVSGKHLWYTNIYGFYTHKKEMSIGVTCADDYWDLDGDLVIKPVLKHAEDMIEETTVYETYYKLAQKFVRADGKIHTTDTPHSLLYAIANQYDMFDLIESGKAINKKDVSYQLEKNLND